jgi:hypothetical protein
VRLKLLETNLLLWCQGPDIPWSDDELSVIYTYELSFLWANELGHFSHLPPNVCSWIWPITDQAHLVRQVDPANEPTIQTDDLAAKSSGKVREARQQPLRSIVLTQH